MTMHDLRTRIAAGEPVTPLDLAAAEAADRLHALEHDVHREQAAATRAAAAMDRQAELLTAWQTDADQLTDRLDQAARQHAAAVAELTACHNALRDLVRHYRDQLHRVDYHLSWPGDIVDHTAGQIICDPDQLPTIRLQLPDAAAYVRWARTMQARRDGRGRGSEGPDAQPPMSAADSEMYGFPGSAERSTNGR